MVTGSLLRLPSMAKVCSDLHTQLVFSMFDVISRLLSCHMDYVFSRIIDKGISPKPLVSNLANKGWEVL